MAYGQSITILTNSNISIANSNIHQTVYVSIHHKQTGLSANSLRKATVNLASKPARSGTSLLDQISVIFLHYTDRLGRAKAHFGTSSLPSYSQSSLSASRIGYIAFNTLS